MPTKNLFGYSVLSRQMLEQLMGKDTPEQDLDPFQLEMLEHGLRGFNVPGHEKRSTGNEFAEQFWTPELMGNNIKEHFESMADEFLKDNGIPKKARYLYRNGPHERPPLSILDVVQPGWNRIWTDGEAWFHRFSDGIEEDAAVYDCETFVKGSPFSMPIIGTACNADANYVWISPQLRCNGYEYQAILYAIANCSLPLHIKCKWLTYDVHPEFDAKTAPMPKLGDNKFIVMHNTAFDACRVSDRYNFFYESGTYYFDTYSAHQVCAGLNARQKWAADLKPEKTKPKFYYYGTKKSLKHAWEFHVGGRGNWPEIGDKKLRGIFVWAPSLKRIRQSWGPLMGYSMNDPITTHETFQEVWKKYRKHAPSKVTLASHLLLSAMVLPLEEDWYSWVQTCDNASNKAADEASAIFLDVAADYHAKWQSGELDPSQDPWLKWLDWRPIGNDIDGNKVARWYFDLRKEGLSSKQASSHYLLKLSWKGAPLRKLSAYPDGQTTGRKKQFGWCYPVAEDEDFDVFADGKHWRKVPHKDGEGKNVGNLLTAAYLRYFDDDILRSEASDGAKQVAILSRLRSYWISIKGRTLECAVGQAVNPFTNAKSTILAPQVVPHNTVSYRTGERLWLTLASHTSPKIGSEIKNKVKPPIGCDIVNFDFDSQELGILSAYSDKYVGISGSTAFSFSVLAGNKKEGTDMHTSTAVKTTEAISGVLPDVTIRRNAAKQSVYAMAYGAYFKTVGNTIKMWHPEIPRGLINKVAKPMLEAFKGKKSRGEEYYNGGLASQAFNAMHDLLKVPEPDTPILGNKMPPAMWPSISGSMDAPEQLNWEVQSAGASMLQCIVVSSWWMAKRFQIPAALCFSMHDEVVFYCHKNFSELWAFLLQICHAWTWCLLHYNIGIYDMPLTRAFAESINIDRTWRKAAKGPKARTKTPTFRDIPDGRELGIGQLYEQSEIAKLRWEALTNA